MDAIKEYKMRKKVDNIYEHITKKEPMIFWFCFTWENFRRSVVPAIEDFLDKYKIKKKDYKQVNWLKKIRTKQKELYGDDD